MYVLPAGINYRQIIGMRIRNSIRENPMVCGKFPVIHYKQDTKSNDSDHLATNECIEH